MGNLDEFADGLQEEVIQQVREKYSETVVDHWLHPRNPGVMENADGCASVSGSCGDTMQIFIRVRDGKISRASFVTDGCLTSIVSGSMAVEMAIGKEIAAAQAISKDDILNNLGGLPEESEHCALLASQTLRAAIADYFAFERQPWKRLYRTP
jgi:nitrogen fixation NifU-like protein